MSIKQIKMYHPDSTEPVRIMPNQLAHFEANGWSNKKPGTSKSSKKPKPATEK